MGYRIKAGESIATAVARIASEQIDKAIAEIGDPDLEVGKRVHQVRKRCKKIRGLLRLVRKSIDDYRALNLVFRDIARGLSAARDADVSLQTFHDLVDDLGARANLHDHAVTIELELQRRRDSALRRAVARLDHAADELRNARGSITEWSIDADGFGALRGGLAKTYRRGRKTMARAIDRLDDESLHEWRKRTKYHGYHLRLLAGIWPAMIETQRKAADRVGELLGDDHDLATLLGRIEKQTVVGAAIAGAEWPGQVRQRVEHRRLQLAAAACDMGERLFAEAPNQLADRLSSYWQTWCESRQLTA